MVWAEKIWQDAWNTRNYVQLSAENQSITIPGLSSNNKCLLFSLWELNLLHDQKFWRVDPMHGLASYSFNSWRWREQESRGRPREKKNNSEDQLGLQPLDRYDRPSSFNNFRAPNQGCGSGLILTGSRSNLSGQTGSGSRHLCLENFPTILWWVLIRNCCLFHFLTVLSHKF